MTPLLPITEIRLTLAPPMPPGHSHGPLAYASITFGAALVVSDVRLIYLPSGRLHVSMPSREIRDRCPSPACRARTAITARFCQRCGVRLADGRVVIDPETGKRLPRHADMCFPIGTEQRHAIEDAVIAEYRRQVEAAEAEAEKVEATATDAA